MKIISYNTNTDESQSFRKIAEEKEVDFLTTSQPLNIRTVRFAEGCDAITDSGLNENYTEALFKKLQDMGIKYISLRTTGYDGIDLNLFREYGIKLANVPSYSPSAIAEFAVTLSMMLLRRMQEFIVRGKAGNFVRTGMMGREMNQMTVGVIGTGAIGIAAAKLFKSFGAQVIAYDAYPRDGVSNILEYKKSAADVFKEADLISLHVPLLPDTKGMVNAEAIAEMKDGVLIVNTARGGVVNDSALLEALTSGKVAGAAIDVYDFDFNHDYSGKAVKDSKLQRYLGLPNVIITPHTAYNTDTAVENMVRISTENLLDFMLTGKSKNDVTAK